MMRSQAIDTIASYLVTNQLSPIHCIARHSSREQSNQNKVVAKKYHDSDRSGASDRKQAKQATRSDSKTGSGRKNARSGRKARKPPAYWPAYWQQGKKQRRQVQFGQVGLLSAEREVG